MTLELVSHQSSGTVSVGLSSHECNEMDAICTSRAAKRDSANTITSDLLRGVPCYILLQNFGKLLQTPPPGSQFSMLHAEAEALYNSSHEVSYLDWFISHAWADSRWAKYICVLFFMNRYRVLVYINVVPAVWLAMMLMGAPWPTFQIVFDFGDEKNSVTLGWIGNLCTMVYIIASMFAHIATPVSDSPSLFLDKCCIHQSDTIRKARGIAKLGGFLRKSRRMLVLWSPRHVDRLWCVYELACYSSLFGWRNIDLIPLVIGPLVYISPCFFLSTTVSYHTLLFTSVEVKVWSGFLPWFVVVVFFIYGFACARIERTLVFLLGRIAKFTLAGAECYCCTVGHRLPDCDLRIPCDRQYVESNIKRWFAELTTSDEQDGIEAFERHVREDLPKNLTVGLGKVIEKVMHILICINGWAGLELAVLNPLVGSASGPDFTYCCVWLGDGE